MSYLTNMNLESLDLWLHLPGYATLFAPKCEINKTPYPELDMEGSKQVGIAIAERITSAQSRPLQTLTLHISRSHEMDRQGSYDYEAMMQFTRNNVGGLSEMKYEVTTAHGWITATYWRTEDFIIFEKSKK